MSGSDDSNGGLWGMENFGSGGGGNFFENVLNSYTQIMTAGVVQYNDKGFKADLNDSVGMNTYKEMSGAKAAEEANEQAREQFEEQKANAATERQNALLQNANDQRKQSLMAGAARNTTSKSTANKGQAVGSFSLGGDEKDFLGI
jgi:hypothetical protein